MGADPQQGRRGATAIDWAVIDAVLFDLDGVITPTAAVHERAWKTTFDGFLARRATATGVPHEPFSAADYLAEVDGKPRFDGVRSFVASRGIDLPEGDVDDPPGDTTICALGNAKNAAFHDLIESQGIAPYPGSQRMLDALAATGVRAAIVSSSRNAPQVLAAAGLGARFEVVVDGNVAAAEGLAGKPAPDTFLAAATKVGVPADRAAVVEDAVPGVAAGRAGGFASVVGVDRGAGVQALRDHGADLVVAELDELLDDDGSIPGAAPR